MAFKLQLKFRAGATAKERQGVIEKATRAGATAVRPLFPGEADEELALLYVVDAADPKYRDSLLSLLKKDRAVEFVEGEVKRKLKS